MKTLITLLVTATSLFGSSCAVYLDAVNSDCHLQEGLYQKRLSLRDWYAREMSTDYADRKTIADQFIAERRALDAQYKNIMDILSKASQEHNHAVMTSCCDRIRNDPIGFQTCQLVLYVSKEGKDVGDMEKFLESFPEDKEAIAVLWGLDEIAFGQPNSTLPNVFSPNGPTFLYIDELFRLVTSNNAKAVEKYFNLYSYADGLYAEYIDDQIVTLFNNYPYVVLHNWDVIKKYKQRFDRLKAILSAADIQSIKNAFQKLCNNGNKNCIEIFGLFEPK